MKDGWIVKKLGEVATFCNGYTPKEADLMNCGEIPYFKVSDMNHVLNSKYLNYTTLYLNKGCKTYPKNTIVFPKNGAAIATNKKRLLAQESVVDLNTGGVYLNTDELLYAYLYLYFLNIDFKFYTRRGAVPTLDIAELKGLNIPIPPLSEQSRIVEELDQLSNIIEKKRQQLSELDNLAQSIFYDMFGDPVVNEKGWEVKPLKENVYEMFLGPFGSALKVDSYVGKEDSYCMVYEQKHAIQGTLDVITHYINKDKYETLKRFEVKAGDFIMSCRGTIGKLYRLPQNSPLGIIHPSLMKIRIRESIYAPKYFEFMLIKVVANESTNGNCVQMAITAKELGNKKLPLPPLSLQQLFAQKIEAIEAEKALIKQSIAETEELFNSRMDYYFG